jgi:hypothetical protein
MNYGRVNINNNARQTAKNEVGDEKVVSGPEPYSFNVMLYKDGEPADIFVRMTAPHGGFRAFIPEKLIRDQLQPGDGQTQIWTIMPDNVSDTTIIARVEMPNENGNIRLKFRASDGYPPVFFERALLAAIRASDMVTNMMSID